MNAPAHYEHTEDTGCQANHPHPQQAKADQIAAGLRRLADTIQQHPELADLLLYPVGNMNAPVPAALHARAAIERFAAVAGSAGAVLAEHNNGAYGGVQVGFGPVRVTAYADKHRLADEPLPPPPPYRPLLGDTTPGGVR